LDVHKESISVAVAERVGEAQDWGTIINTPEAVRKLVRQLGPREKLLVAYEAGPCGYELYRQLWSMEVQCVVVAPSLVPRRPGDRVKTDRRDARQLARLLRSGELTPVWVPDEDHEALRDLVRAREDAKEDQQRKRHQLGKFLLRSGLRPPAGVRAWTQRHRQWLETLALPRVAQRVVLREYLRALDEVTDRIGRLDGEIALMAQECPQAPVIRALGAFRGIGLTTAVTIVAELGDISRFDRPTQLMAYAGLVPSEHSSGQSRRLGGITKTGNSHLRRVVVEAAWHYRHLPRVGADLKRRQAGLDPSITAIGWRAQSRLNRKYRRMVGRGKPKQKAVVAVARELLGFIWELARAVQQVQAEKAA
jgi:transposase